MKKSLLFTVFTMMLSVASYAQNNTYNMVVKMANGTTISIGPNEIENISFNDGAVTISGTKIDDLVKNLESAQKDISSLRALIEYVDGKTSKIEIINGNWFINGVDTGIRAEGRDGKDGKDGQDGSGGSADVNKIKEAININSKSIHEIQNLIANGGVITKVESIENGVRLTMTGNLGSFDIRNGVDGRDGRDGKDGVNGRDGKDGNTWSIGEDGFWYENGIKTAYYALGAGKQDVNELSDEIKLLNEKIENLKNQVDKNTDNIIKLLSITGAL